MPALVLVARFLDRLAVVLQRFVRMPVLIFVSMRWPTATAGL